MFPTKSPEAHIWVEDCRFCQVARGAWPALAVFEDDVSLAFLDHRPLFPGHCLLIPKSHYETLQDLPSALLAPFFANAQLVTQAVEQAMKAEGSFVALNNRVSQSVPHLHVHIVPRRRKDGLRGFFWPRQAYKDETAARAAQSAIQSAIARLRPAREST